MTPKRHQLSRKKGSKRAHGVVSVDRRTRWGNPHKVGETCTPQQAVDRFKADLEAGKLAFSVADVQRELAGRPLGCWCRPDAPCHADVLLAAANSGFPSR